MKDTNKVIRILNMLSHIFSDWANATLPQSFMHSQGEHLSRDFQNHVRWGCNVSVQDQ